MQIKNNIQPLQFTFFRVCLGMYFAFHFVFLIPDAEAMFSNLGMLANAEDNPTNVLFPFNILNYLDDPISVQIFLIILSVLSITLTIGFKRRITSAILLYGWICLFNRNNLTLEPGMAYMGWFLLNLVFIPEGEPYSFRQKKNNSWEMPQIVFASTWFLMALGYTLSGIDKWYSISWADGSAIQKLMLSPLMNDNSAVHLFQNSSEITFTSITYFILFLELLFLPLAFFKYARPILWIGMIFVHLGILITMNMADLTVSMFILHIFTFDASWIPQRKTKLKPVSV